MIVFIRVSPNIILKFISEITGYLDTVFFTDVPINFVIIILFL